MGGFRHFLSLTFREVTKQETVYLTVRLTIKGGLTPMAHAHGLISDHMHFVKLFLPIFYSFFTLVTTENHKT